MGAAFALNWAWELAQRPAYAEAAGHPLRESLHVVCTLGDMGITLGIYGGVALATGRLRWGAERRWNAYAAAGLLGAGWATAIEWRALAFGRWSYTEWMPVVPVLGVGLWPFLQLTLLVPAALWVAARWSPRLSMRSEAL